MTGLAYFERRTMRNLLALIAFFVLRLSAAPPGAAAGFPAGVQAGVPDSARSPQDARFREVAAGIEDGIRRNDASLLAPHFAGQLYLSLRSEEEGYYSANQASLVLEHYFAGRKFLNFRFTTTGTQGRNAYATGGGTIMVRGMTEIIQVYVSFRQRGGEWVVTQFNIY